MLPDDVWVDEYDEQADLLDEEAHVARLELLG